ncbi:putative collagen-binding domain-containing protein, partial [Planctomycetota bacterium]
FSKGKDIAIKPFRPEKPFATGKFHIGPFDKKAPDSRAKGMLRYVGKRYLQFAETGEFFIKGGADTPENFLAYYEFDGTYDTNDNGDILENGFLHKYPNHLKDWHQGDPTFKNGKGKAIIGALNYLAWKGMNSVYFIPYNIDGGDGKDTWPWMNHTHRLRFDCSKLDQWEIVLSHMDKLGLMLHIILQEEENAHQLDEGNLGKQRKLYYREIIARFSHHLAILWNLGEEITNTTEQQMAFAEYIHKIDPYDHPVILHTYPDNHDEIYTPLLGFEFIEGASLQTDKADKMTKKWIERSTQKGRAWIVFMDEIANVEIGVAPDSVDYTHDMPRKEYLWPSLLAGGAGVEWYFGYSFPDNDIECEDWRSRDHMWDLTRYAIDFFHKYLPFTEMHSADELTTAANDYCFAKPGQIYAIYLPDGGTTELDLGQSSEKFTIKWYNPREGGNLLDGSIKTISGPGKKPIGLPPSDNNKDWLALIDLSSLNAD